ncbi:MAG: hypothetical protein ACE5GM_09335 [bacterium]
MPSVKEIEKMVSELPLSSKLVLFSDLEDELLAQNENILKELDNARKEIQRGETATLKEVMSVLKGKNG